VISRLLIEYDGRDFAGWARQPGARTVQAELERTLAVLLRHPVELSVAGRTDSGVHALGQVASYRGPTVRASGLNALLPDDVAVRSCEPAPDGFDARHDATSRAYCYRVLLRRSRSALWRGRAWHRSGEVNAGALQACAAALAGVHDFTAFTPTETHHVRFARDGYQASWRTSPQDPEVLEFWIEADAFMRHMNRVLVGTMLEVASGRRSVDGFVALLEGAPRARAGQTAPAHGLYLIEVGYEGARLLPRVLCAGNPH
jgi:tRNA pseudouridine38-40 synthase